MHAMTFDKEIGEMLNSWLLSLHLSAADCPTDNLCCPVPHVLLRPPLVPSAAPVELVEVQGEDQEAHSVRRVALVLLQVGRQAGSAEPKVGTVSPCQTSSCTVLQGVLVRYLPTYVPTCRRVMSSWKAAW